MALVTRLGILILNLTPNKQTPFEIARAKADHSALGKIFLSANQPAVAEKEFRLAGDLSEASLAAKLAAEPALIEREIARLETLVRTYPDFRDGYIRLAILYWKLGQQDQAWDYLDQASQFDPNNDIIRKIRKDWQEPKFAVPELPLPR